MYGTSNAKQRPEPMNVSEFKRITCKLPTRRNFTYLPTSSKILTYDPLWKGLSVQFRELFISESST